MHSQEHSYTSCFHKITTIVMPPNSYMINPTSNPIKENVICHNPYETSYDTTMIAVEKRKLLSHL